jgi:hypothetical protein
VPAYLHKSQKKQRAKNKSDFKQSKLNLSIDFDPNRTQEIGSHFTTISSINRKANNLYDSINSPPLNTNNEFKLKNKNFDSIITKQQRSTLDKFQPETTKNVYIFSNPVGD